MGLFDAISNMFSGKKTLQDLSMDDLMQERIRLRQTEKQLMEKIDGIEKEKKGLFAEGTKESSERKRLILARQIKEKDVQAQNYDKSLNVISKQQRTINGLLQLKENEKLLKQSGLSSMIARMDLAELQGWVEKSSVDGEFKMEKLSEILGVVEGTDTLPGANRSEDEDILAIMDQMQRANEMQNDASSVEGIFKEMSKDLKSKDRE